MESKLLAGGMNIIDRRDEQQRHLKRQRQEMIEQRVPYMHAINTAIYSCWLSSS